MALLDRAIVRALPAVPKAVVRRISSRYIAGTELADACRAVRELNAQGHRTKSWTTQAGTFRAGRPFDKGTLYKILRNRTYLGEAVHKGKSYPGEHEPIIAPDLFEAVQEMLAANHPLHAKLFAALVTAAKAPAAV